MQTENVGSQVQKAEKTLSPFSAVCLPTCHGVVMFCFVLFLFYFHCTSSGSGVLTRQCRPSPAPTASPPQLSTWSWACTQSPAGVEGSGNHQAGRVGSSGSPQQRTEDHLGRQRQIRPHMSRGSKLHGPISLHLKDILRISKVS